MSQEITPLDNEAVAPAGTGMPPRDGQRTVHLAVVGAVLLVELSWLTLLSFLVWTWVLGS